ncbi:hypothetical protein PDJAM_G00101860 [Pangasius djambal]|uniref:Uncharacterized protein n=1 Tax=Pangasius djambal TaxID=1691987 RepID=A0ACC5Z890_9TELE|nr:hypothetical protein [Pangasius djambal]
MSTHAIIIKQLCCDRKCFSFTRWLGDTFNMMRRHHSWFAVHQECFHAERWLTHLSSMSVCVYVCISKCTMALESGASAFMQILNRKVFNLS